MSSGVPALSWGSSSSNQGTPVRTSLNPVAPSNASGSISARYHAIAGSSGSAAASASAAMASGSLSARTPSKHSATSQQRVHLPSVVPSPASASASASARRGADTPSSTAAHPASGAPSPALSGSARLRRLRKSFADIDEMAGASPGGAQRMLHPRAPAQGSPLSPLSTVSERGTAADTAEHARTSSLITTDMLFNPSTAGLGLGGVSAGGVHRAPSAVAEEKYEEQSESGRDSAWGDDGASSHAGDAASQTGGGEESQGLLLSAAPLLADLHAASKMASAPGAKGDPASGPAAAARAFHPILSKQSSRLERKLRVASSLLAAAAKSCRTTREAKTVSRITQALEGLGAEESALLSSFTEELSRAEAALVGASTLATSYASLQSKLGALDFDAWSSQSALVDSIQSIERDIVRLGESGVLPTPAYQHALHPVANLVCKKFRRLEELVFLLKRKVAEQARYVQLGNERGANRSLGEEREQSPVPAESSGASARGAATPGPTSAAPVSVMDESLSAILSEFGSLSGLLRENSSLRRRNAALTRALKSLRSHPGAQAAMQLLSAPEKAAINAAVAPSLAASFAPGFTSAGAGSGGEGMHSLRPAVYSFLSRYDSMWMQMFEAFAESSGGGSAVGSTANLMQLAPASPSSLAGPASASAAAGAAAALAGHNAVRATRAARSLTLGELLRWGAAFGVTPHRLTPIALEHLVALCVASKEFIVQWDSSAAGKLSNNTLDFFGFKELVARVALALSPTTGQQGAAALAGVGLPSQLDRVQSFVFDLDLTMQDQSFGWAGLLGAGAGVGSFVGASARSSQSSAGASSSSGAVVSLLTKQDSLLREVFVHYASIASTAVVEVIQSMAARLTGSDSSSTDQSNGRASATGSAGVIGAEGTLSAGGDAARTSLVWSEEAFLRFAREWGIQDHLLTPQQLMSLFASAAVSHPLAPVVAGSAQQQTREARQRLLYPEFKLLLARLALVANERYSALDPRALFDAASAANKQAHAASSASLGEAAMMHLSSSMSSLSAGGEGFDPSLTIVTQFLDHLGLGADARSEEARVSLRRKLRALREASEAEQGQMVFEHKTVEFDPVPAQTVSERAPANSAEAALWNMQEHARRQIRLAGQRERERERDRANGVFDSEASTDLDSSASAVLSDEAQLAQYADVLSQAFAMYARSTRRVVVGATGAAAQVSRGAAAAAGTVKAIAWADFLTFAEDFRIVPQLLPHPSALSVTAAVMGSPASKSAAASPPVNIQSMFISAAVLPAAVAAKKSRASRAAAAAAKALEDSDSLRGSQAPQVEPEAAPLTYPEFCRLLLRIARAVPTDGYRSAEDAEPTTVFLEHLASRFVFDWHEAADVVQRSLGSFVPPVAGSAPAAARKTLTASAAREAFDRDTSFAHDPLRAPTIADVPGGDDDGGDFYRSASPEPAQHQPLSANTFMDPSEEESMMQAEESSEEEQEAAKPRPLAVSLPSPARTPAAGLDSPSSSSASASASASAYASVSPPEVTFAWLKPDAVRAGSSAAILARIRAEGFEILASELRQLDPMEIDAFYAEHTRQPWFGGLKSFLLSGPSRALALRKPNAVAEWRRLMGPTNSIKARAEAPSSLRALFGTDGQRNATHGSDSVESAARELQLVFSQFASVAGSQNSQLRDQVPVFVLVKPDAVAAGSVAPIIARFEAESRSIRVLSRGEITLTPGQVEELYRVHPLKLQAAACAAQLADLDAQRQGRSTAAAAGSGATSPSGGLSTVAYAQRSKQLLAQLQILDQNWAAFRAFMSSGPVVALAVQVNAAFVKSGALAALVGPTDPAVAKTSAPQSLRALFGSSLYRNAVHVSVGLGSALPQTLKEMRELLGGFTPAIQTTLVILKPALAADAKAVSALLTRLRAVAGLEIERTESLPIREDVRKIAFTSEQAQELFGAGAAAADAAAGAAVSDSAAAGVAGDSSASQSEAVSSLLSPDHPSYAFRVRGLDAVRAVRLWLASAASGLSAQDRANVHASLTLEAALREVRLVFDQYRDSIQTTLALIKPDAVASGYTKRIIDRALSEGFEILRIEECLRLSESNVREIYADQQSASGFPLLCKFMTSGPLVALSLRRENAVEAWREVVGSPEIKSSLRAELATDSTRDAVHASASLAAAARELDLIFTRLAPLEQSTFALLKPGFAGAPAEEQILARIAEQGFDVLRMERVERLSSLQIRRLFAAHKHTWQQAPAVIEKVPGAKPAASAVSYLSPSSASQQPSFEEFSNYMSSGAVLGLVLRRAQAVRAFKQLVGGSTMDAVLDPTRARAEAPSCLRAEFGKDLLRNALHASASLDDARRELGLFFGSAAFYPPPQSTLLLLKPPLIAAGHTDAVVRRVAAQGFEILRQKKMQLSAAQVQQLFGSRPSAAAVSSEALPNLDLDASSGVVAAVDPELVSMLSGSPVIALHVQKPDAVVQMQKLCGVIAPAAAASASSAASSEANGSSVASSSSSSAADAPSASDADAPLFLASTLEHLKSVAPSTLRALYATDASALGDGVYCSTSVPVAEREIDQIFHEWFPEAAQSTLALLKPDLYGAVGSGAGTEAGRAAQVRVDQILARIAEEGFEIVRRSQVRLSESQVRLLYAEHKGRIFLPALVSFMSSGASLALELKRIDGVKHWRRVIGPTDPARARTEAPGCLRAQFGTDGLRNGLHGSASPAKAARELSLVFDQFVSLIEETCVLLKPEVIASGQSHAMRRAIQSAGFEILKTEKMTLTTQQAMRFYAEHAGSGYFTDLVQYMTSGAVVALLLRKENAITDFRALMGCTDSSLARRTAPNSLRALFGRDKKRNAVHGSESKESASREISMVFRDFSVGAQDTFAFIKPDAFNHAQAIIARLAEEGFAVRTQIVRTLSAAQARIFYEEHSAAPFFPALVQYMSSGPVVGLVLRKENAVRALRELAGPTNSIDAKQSDPESLRAIWGTDGLRNGFHASKSLEAARRELSLVFNSFFVGVQTTTVLITPDSVGLQYEAAILAAFRNAGFEIVRKKALSLTAEQARVFLAAEADSAASAAASGPRSPSASAPRAVDPLFEQRVAFISSGPSIALELRREDAVKAALDLMGPSSPDVARSQAPQSIRALYGSSALHNAALVSASVDASARECALLFDTFSSSLLTTLAILKPDVVKRGQDEAILARLTGVEGFELLAQKRVKLSAAQAKALYAADAGKSFFKAAVEFISSGPLVCLALRKNSALSELQKVCGDANPKVAKKQNPNSLRGLYGTTSNQNAIHCPESLLANAREMSLMFDEYNFDLLG